jgi:hypothetical protein
MFRRLITLVVLTLLVSAAGLVDSSAAGAASPTGRTLAALAVRGGPGGSNASVGSIGSGVSVAFHCFVAGERVAGPYGSEDIWDALDSGGFVPDALIYTGSNSAVVGACPSAQFGVGRYPIAWTGGGGFTPRAGPHTAAAAAGGNLPDGLLVSITCETTGDMVTDAAGFSSNLWDRTDGGTYMPNVYLDTQVNGPTPGVGQCAASAPGPGTDPSQNPGRPAVPPVTKGAPPTPPAAAPTRTKAANSDPCIAVFGAGGTQSTHSIFGGQESDYDRTASLYQVCEGFGSDGVGFSTEAKCLIIAVALSLDGKAGRASRDLNEKVCDALDVAGKVKTGDWMGAAGGALCAFLGATVPEAAGIFAAGVASETGPGAVAVGVRTYQALAVIIPVACGGLLAKAHDLGAQWETNQEHHAAQQIIDDGKCLRSRKVFGFLSWSAAAC